MNFEISAVTDIGISKDKNQDCYHIRLCETALGPVVLAVLSDGMGGLCEGEVASATVVKAFCRWADENLPKWTNIDLLFENIHKEWKNILEECNEKIRSYGQKKGIRLGTTVTVMLFVGDTYYIIHVGDTRVYEITDKIRVLTTDHTLTAREVELGNLTSEQAKVDYRQHILLQCVGASDEILPEFLSGKIQEYAVYILCTDGFRHEITEEEISAYLNAKAIQHLNKKKDTRCQEESMMHSNIKKLVELNKQRKEKDNITVIGIKTSSGEDLHA